jgi:hypothetical protein
MKCEHCGRELELSGFESDGKGNGVDFYSCRNEKCGKRTRQIRVGWGST